MSYRLCPRSGPKSSCFLTMKFSLWTGTYLLQILPIGHLESKRISLSTLVASHYVSLPFLKASGKGAMLFSAEHHLCISWPVTMKGNFSIWWWKHQRCQIFNLEVIKKLKLHLACIILTFSNVSRFYHYQYFIFSN